MANSEIFEVFNSCLNSEISIMNGVSKLSSILNKGSIDDFKLSINKCICKILLYGNKYNEISRLIELLSNFLTSSDVVKRQTCDNLDESMFEIEPVFYIILKFVLSYNNADSKDVRLVVCGLITKILTSLASDIKLEVSLIEEITNIMLERLSDISSNVRVKAVQALSRLQDPENLACPIIDHYIKALECDCNVNVRKSIIQNICITSLSLPVIIGRVWDIKPIIRLNAYERLRKSVPVKALKIDQRSKIVFAGLREKNKDIKDLFNQLIIDHWFISCCNGELLNYVKLFDVYEDYEILIESFNFILTNIDESNLSKCYDQIKTWLDPSQNIFTTNGIDCEKIFTWCRFISNMISSKIKLATCQNIEIPEISDICNIMETYFPKLVYSLEPINAEEFDPHIFIFKELLNLLQSFSLNDEAGRKIALDLLSKVLQLTKLNLSVIPAIIKCYIYYSTTPSKALDSIVEIISEIRQPIDNTTAAQCQEDHLLSSPSIPNSIEDTDILSLCLTIAAELLYVKNIDLISPSAISLLTSFILPLVQDSRSSIRFKAVKCLSIFCICLRQFAQKYLILLFHIVKLDSIEIRKLAISAIFDIYIIYGTDIIPDNEDDTENTMNVEYLHKIIEDESDTDIITILVAGLCKLILYKRNNSPLILSSLIVLFLSPEYEKESKVKEIIGIFFSNYLKNGFMEYHNILIPAFYMALEEILICDTDSILANVQLQHVINLLTNLASFSTTHLQQTENKSSFKERLIVYFLTKLTQFDGEIMFIRDCLRILSSLTSISTTTEGMTETTHLAQKLQDKLKDLNDTRSLRYVTKILENISGKNTTVEIS